MHAFALARFTSTSNCLTFDILILGLLRVGKRSFASTHRDGGLAPIPDLHALAMKREVRPSTVIDGSAGVAAQSGSPPGRSSGPGGGAGPIIPALTNMPNAPATT